MQHDDSLGRSEHKPIYVAVTPTDERLDLLNLLRLLDQGKWLMACTVAIFVIAAVCYSIFAQRIYESEMTLAQVNVSAASSGLSRLSSLAGIAGINLAADDNSAKSLAILESNKIAEDFIRDKNLLPVLFADEWSADKKNWKSDDRAEQPDIRDGVEYFTKHVRIASKDAQTGLVLFAIRWRDPEIAAQWATEFVQRANEAARQRDIREGQQKLDYLNDQMKSSQIVETRAAIAKVMEDQINATMLASATAEYAFEVVDPAPIPKRPVWPQPLLLVVGAIVLGSFVGFGLLVCRTVGQRLKVPASNSVA
jgi:uncharacterized protein involved in exopolysaccharide biosynthesis